MKGWYGATISLAVGLVALFATRYGIYGIADPNSARVAFSGTLALALVIAMNLTVATPEWTIARQASVWASMFALLAIFSINLRSIPASQLVKEQIVADNPVKPKKHVKRVYDNGDRPHALNQNQEETIVTTDPENKLADIFGEKKAIKNYFSSEESRLADDWQPNDDDKRRFAKFLQRQGLEYDPRTAFATSDTETGDLDQ